MVVAPVSYLGTCVVCGEAITDRFDLAWAPSSDHGLPRRRVHLTDCLAKAEVQAGPTIEGPMPAARDYDARCAWIIAHARGASRPLDTLYFGLERWLADLRAEGVGLAQTSPPREEEGGR